MGLEVRRLREQRLEISACSKKIEALFEWLLSSPFGEMRSKETMANEPLVYGRTMSLCKH